MWFCEVVKTALHLLTFMCSASLHRAGSAMVWSNATDFLEKRSQESELSPWKEVGSLARGWDRALGPQPRKNILLTRPRVPGWMAQCPPSAQEQGEASQAVR